MEFGRSWATAWLESMHLHAHSLLMQWLYGPQIHPNRNTNDEIMAINSNLKQPHGSMIKYFKINAFASKRARAPLRIDVFSKTSAKSTWRLYSVYRFRVFAMQDIGCALAHGPSFLCNRCAFEWRTHSGVKAKIEVKRNARSHKMWIEHGTNKLVLSKINDFFSFRLFCFRVQCNHGWVAKTWPKLAGNVPVFGEWRRCGRNGVSFGTNARWRQWPVWIAWLRHLYVFKLLPPKRDHAAH